MIVASLASFLAFLVKMIEEEMSEWHSDETEEELFSELSSGAPDEEPESDSGLTDEEMGVMSSTCLDSEWALAELDS